MLRHVSVRLHRLEAQVIRYELSKILEKGNFEESEKEQCFVNKIKKRYILHLTEGFELFRII